MRQTSYIGEWGGQFLVPIPEPRAYAAQPTPLAVQEAVR